MIAGLWDDIVSGAQKTVNAAQSEVKAKIVEFAKAKAAAEKNYAALLEQNNYRIAKKDFFKTEAERQAFQKLLNEGTAAVNTARTVRNSLLVALRAVNANPSDYGLGIVPFIIPVAVAVGIYESVKALNSFVKSSAPAVTQETLVKQGVPPAEAVKLSNESLIAKAAADKAQADLNKSTLDRVMDNLPLIAGGLAAVIALPKVLELLPKPKQGRA